MNNKILMGFAISMVVLSVIATAKIYNVEIDLNPKQDEWLTSKMNNTGKSAGDLIEADVQILYGLEYDDDLGDKFITVAQKLIELKDYKKTIEGIKALESILK